MQPVGGYDFCHSVFLWRMTSPLLFRKYGVLVIWVGDLVLVTGTCDQCNSWNTGDSQCSLGKLIFLCPGESVFSRADFVLSQVNSVMTCVDPEGVVNIHQEGKEGALTLRKSHEIIHCVSHHKTVSVDIS